MVLEPDLSFVTAVHASWVSFAKLRPDQAIGVLFRSTCDAKTRKANAHGWPASLVDRSRFAKRPRARLERARDQLQELLKSEEINVMDARLSALVRKGEARGKMVAAPVVERSKSDSRDFRQAPRR